MEEIICSIIIPSYNHGHHLEESIDSALSQTFKGVEVIVVDDGSTDDTPARMERFGDRITYIRQENGGLGNARNTGIRASRGRFLQFLDADDRIESNKLELQVPYLLSDETIDVVYSDCLMTGPGIDNSVNASRPINEADPLATLVKDNPMPVHAALVRKEAVVRSGMFDESRAIHEDWDLWLRLALGGSKFLYMPGNLAHYRREGSVISSDRELMFHRTRNLLLKHIDNPDLISYGKSYLNKFVARQYIYFSSQARERQCWSLCRRLLYLAAKTDALSLTLRLWVYFPETLIYQAVDILTRTERRVPEYIRNAV